VHLPLKRATRASNSRAVSAQLFSALTGGQRFPVMIGVIWLAVCSHRISIPLLLSQITCPTREHGDCAEAADGRRSASSPRTTEPIFMSPSGKMSRSDVPEYRVLKWKETPLAFRGSWGVAQYAGLGKACAFG
jgi:hypothetical protein